MTGEDPQRTYEVLSRVGKGAFGEVYHARMHATDGVHEVALKIARDNPTPSALARFRDEARILVLLRDPAIVTARPPIQLDGRWALVMEYVDGASVAQVLRRSKFSPRAAVELVAEVARALHTAHTAKGPDNVPLGLVHRDLKPGNLMLTAGGTVKLLDFGIARADFDEREAQTVGTFVGTPGYIAPERLRGIGGPALDVFSLGVLLHVLVTGVPAVRISDRDGHGAGPDVAKVLAYARELYAEDPEERPTALQVANECRAWGPQLDGIVLASHAASVVPQVQVREVGELAGTVLVETLAAAAEHPEPVAARWPSWVIGALGLGTLAVLLLMVVWVRRGASEEREGLVPVAVEPAETPLRIEPPPVVAPPVQVAPVPTPPPPKRRAAPPPPPARPRLVITSFLSEPSGAEVRIDGFVVGHTPLRNHPLSEGEHELSFHHPRGVTTRTVRVGGRYGSREFVWTDEGIIAQ